MGPGIKERQKERISFQERVARSNESTNTREKRDSVAIAGEQCSFIAAERRGNLQTLPSNCERRFPSFLGERRVRVNAKRSERAELEPRISDIGRKPKESLFASAPLAYFAVALDPAQLTVRSSRSFQCPRLHSRFWKSVWQQARQLVP